MWIALKVRSSNAPLAANDAAVLRGRQAFGQVGLVIPRIQLRDLSRWSEVDAFNRRLSAAAVS